MKFVGVSRQRSSGGEYNFLPLTKNKVKHSKITKNNINGFKTENKELVVSLEYNK